MILDNVGGKTIGGDEFEDHKIGFSQEHVAQLFRDVTTYSNPIGSVVREITTNCFDSHERANVDQDVEIVMKRGSSLDNEESMIYFKDFGTGLSKQKIVNIFLNVGASDKRSGNSEHGGFGRGSKAPFGYIRDRDLNGFYLETWYDGTVTKYFLVETDEGPRMMKLYEKNTSRTNGTTVSVPIADGDWSKFQEEIKRQLAYFDNISYVNCNVDDDYTIYKTDNIVYRSDYQPFNEVHVCHGKVAYPLDYNEVNISSRYYSYGGEGLDAPIALYFDIGELSVTPTRESLNYNERTIAAIEEKMEIAAKECQEMYNNQFDDVQSIEDYLKYVDTTKTSIYFNVDGNEITIPVCDALVESKDPRYPKYDVDLPTRYWKIFSGWSNYKTTDSVGHIKQHDSGYSIHQLINSNKKNKTFIVDNKYSTKKNKFLCSSFGEDLDRVYLVKNTSSNYTLEYVEDENYFNNTTYYGINGEDLTREQKELLIWALNKDRYRFNCKSVNSFEELKQFKQFYDEVDEYVRSVFRDYSNVEVTEEYEEHLKSKRKSRKTKQRPDDKFPLKVIEKENGKYKWSMEDWKYDDINEDYTYIYGFSDDSDKLLSLGPFWSLWDYRVKVIKIAMSREELFDLPHSYHIDDFMKEKLYNSLFVRPVITAWVTKYYDKGEYNLNEHLKRNEVFKKYQESFDTLKNFRNNSYNTKPILSTDIGKEIKRHYKLTDPFELDCKSDLSYHFQTIAGIKQIVKERFYLLDYIRTTYYSDDKLVQEIDEYIQAKVSTQNIHPALYYRLNKTKE